LKEAEMLSPSWIALNRGTTAEPLLGHQNQHPFRAAGSFWLKGAIMFKAGRQPAQANRVTPAVSALEQIRKA
jgi:hypothetical protein